MPTFAPSPTEPLPEGWTRLRLGRSKLERICSDGTTTWAVDKDLGVVRAGEPWQDLGLAIRDEKLVDVDARDGILWAVTSTQLQRFDGTAWNAIALPHVLWDPRAVAARADGRIAVLSSSIGETCCGPTATNVLGIWNGTDWVLHASGPAYSLYDLAETASGDLVAVGDGGWVARWNGTTWVDLFQSGDDRLLEVTAHGDEIVAVGDEGLVVRGPLDALTAERTGPDRWGAVDVAEDGTIWVLSDAGATSRVWVYRESWSEVAMPEGVAQWSDLQATGDGVLLVGSLSGPTAMLGGTEGWSVAWRQGSLAVVNDLWLDPEGAAWIGAYYGGVGRWDSAGLETWPAPPSVVYGMSGVRSLSGSGPDDVAGIWSYGLALWDGTDFAFLPPVGDERLVDVSVAPDGTAFAVGSRDGEPLLLRRDAGVWSTDPTPIPTTASNLHQVVAFAADDVYALGGSALLRFDGASWTDLTGDLGVGNPWLWGRSGSDLYIGGWPDRSLLHWDGTAATEVPGAPPYVLDIAGTDDTLVVYGSDGLSS